MVTGCPTCFFDGFCAHKYRKKTGPRTLATKKWGAHPMKSPASGFLDIDLFLAPQSSWVGTESINPTACADALRTQPKSFPSQNSAHRWQAWVFDLCIFIRQYIRLALSLRLPVLYNVLDFFREPETYSKIGFLQLFARFLFLADFDWLQPYSNIDLFQLLARIILLAAVFFIKHST